MIEDYLIDQKGKTKKNLCSSIFWFETFYNNAIEILSLL